MNVSIVSLTLLEKAICPWHRKWRSYNRKYGQFQIVAKKWIFYKPLTFYLTAERKSYWPMKSVFPASFLLSLKPLPSVILESCPWPYARQNLLPSLVRNEPRDHYNDKTTWQTSESKPVAKFGPFHFLIVIQKNHSYFAKKNKTKHRSWAMNQKRRF